MNKMILYVLTTVTLLLVGCISLPYVGKLVKDNISEDQKTKAYGTIPDYGALSRKPGREDFVVIGSEGFKELIRMYKESVINDSKLSQDNKES